jgi:hypothetical protein
VRIRLGLPSDLTGVSVTFSHDGRMLAVGTGAAAYVWTFPDPGDPEEFRHADPTEFTPFLGYGVSVGFTRDSRILLTSGDLAVEGWNIQDRLRVFDAYIDHGAGNLDLGGTECHRCRKAARGVPLRPVRGPLLAARRGPASRDHGGDALTVRW